MATPKHILRGDSYQKEYNLINENFRQASDQIDISNTAGNRLVVKDDNGVPRVLMGKQVDGFGDDGDFGIKVSKTGIDVTDCEDSDLVMSSAFNNLKVFESGTYPIVIPNPGSYTTVQIPHSIGYAATAMVYGRSGASTSRPLPMLILKEISGYFQCTEKVEFSVDADYLYVNWYKSSSAGSMGSGATVQLKYYLFGETA